MQTDVSVGSATIIALSDTEQPYGALNVYPEATEESLAAYREYLTDDGAVLLNFGCYLIRADSRTVLVDTGWGPSFNGRLMDEIAAAGVGTAEIDAVVFTHLHGDHIGWNIVEDGDELRPRFPRARYLVPEADWEHYLNLGALSPVASAPSQPPTAGALPPRPPGQPEPSALFKSQVVPLESLGVMDLVGGEHALSASVTTVATPGHTPGHLSIAVTSGGEHGFILGDVIISPIDAYAPHWVNRFDWDGEMAGRTRHAVLERLERDRALVGASHFPKPGLGRFVRVDGRHTWKPL